MPKWEASQQFWKDLDRLSPEDRRRFKAGVERFIEGLRSGDMPPGLVVKPVQGSSGVFEMRWAPDGRATFRYGRGAPGDPKIIWLRIGGHEIFKSPDGD